MTYEPIKTLSVENYGCIKKTEFQLSPLHALIGPNDSGKSTALRALRTVAQFGAGRFIPTENAEYHEPFDPMLDMRVRRAESTTIGVRYEGALAYSIHTSSGSLDESVVSLDGKATTEQSRGWNVHGLLRRRSPEGPTSQDRASALKLDLNLEPLRSRLTTAVMIRFDPDSLRAASSLIPEAQGVGFLDDRGTGLASVFDAIINRHSDARSMIEDSVRSLFPTIASVGLRNVSESAKEIGATLTNGTRLGAKEMSEGLLYFIAFAVLKYVDDSHLFLVEEPENGLHPSRIADVMRVLREISKTRQVVIATHSPLVVNELQGHEISVVTRDPLEGTQACLLKDVPGFDDAMKVYLPGEFWVSYADGKMEQPLIDGRPRV